jgi:ABC-type multidrug transport system fused ATPase/permease subunit
MSGLSDAGDVVTGGLWAAAVEPAHGRQAEGVHGGNCLNCGETLTGSYCASCGQPAHVHRTLGAIWHDLMHSVLHFDGKIWRTLPELALRPGDLTRRYIHGERAKFVSPFALFLFSALLMYAVYSIFGHHGSSPQANAQESARVLQKQVEKLDDRIASTEADLKESDLSTARRAKLQQRLTEARDDRQELAAAGAIAADVGQKSAKGDLAGRSVVEQIQTNKEFVAYKLKANAYKFSWALILISTPMIWLLFAWRRDYSLYDHATFVTYSISFMSLLFSLWMVASWIGLATGVITLALMLYALWHMYADMRDAYRLSRTGALLRLPLLYGIAAVSAGMFYALVTGMS